MQWFSPSKYTCSLRNSLACSGVRLNFRDLNKHESEWRKVSSRLFYPLLKSSGPRPQTHRNLELSYLQRKWRPEEPEPLTAAPFKDSSVLTLLQVWWRKPLSLLMIRPEKHTWVFCQEVDLWLCQERQERIEGREVMNRGLKSLITSEVPVKHLSHIFMFLLTLLAP